MPRRKIEIKAFFNIDFYSEDFSENDADCSLKLFFKNINLMYYALKSDK